MENYSKKVQFRSSGPQNKTKLFHVFSKKQDLNDKPIY